MIDEILKERMRDPDYLDLHMVAIAALSETPGPQWYDAFFLKRYWVAIRVLEQVAPEKVAGFKSAFDTVRPVDGWRPKLMDELFDPATHQRIKDAVRAIPESRFKSYEKETFGRRILHHYPYFVELQAELLDRVSELAGRPLECGYNFLSLYGTGGKCRPHLDEPVSMYTLDFCIDQSDDWPLYFSEPIQWDAIVPDNEWSPTQLLNDPKVQFSEYILRPNQALLFNGSSQWHYRNSITPGGYCHLLFFHYYPKGAAGLVHPEDWADHFDMPELRPLCDLFSIETAELDARV
ncbi:MAG: hypothetical protein AAFQ16_09490 [Pseudomonadota bacterium]